MKLQAQVGYGCLVAALVACGGISRVDRSGPQDGAAGSSFGGAGSGGQRGSEVAGSASAGRAAAGGSLGDLAACAPFKDQAPEPVMVRVVNETTSWIFLGSPTPVCGTSPLFGVRGSVVVESQVLVLDRYEPAACRVPCPGYFGGDGSDTCGGACPPSSVVRLGPGESVVTEWSGLYDSDQWMPSECDAVSGSEWGVGCNVATRNSPGTYEFLVEAGAAVACNGGSAGCGDCLPNPGGGCTISGATIMGRMFDGYTQVDLDERDGLTGSAGADDAGTASPTRTVEVVVNDAQ